MIRPALSYFAILYVLITVHANHLQAEETSASSAQAPARVAIYDHSGGSVSEPHNLMRFLTADAKFECRRVTPEEIREGCLADFDVLIVPGGSGSTQAKNLEEGGLNKIREFVTDGGGYVGICAGAYLASTQYSWSLNLINARVWDRTHWARGTGDVKLSLTKSGCRLLNVSESELTVTYAQGPLLVPDTQTNLPGYEVLATYKTEVALKGAPHEAMVGTHAIIRSSYGKGRVICFSPHPEKQGGPNHIMAAGVRWAAKPVVSAQASSAVTAD